MTKTIRMSREQFFRLLAESGWTSGAAPTLDDELRIFGGKVEIIMRSPPDYQPVPIKSDRLLDGDVSWWVYMLLGWAFAVVFIAVVYCVVRLR